MRVSADIAIIGGGPVGLFCAFQAGMLGMRSIIIDAMPNIGGQCSALYPEKPIYDIPAYPKILAGQLIENLRAQCEPFNPQYLLNQQVKELQSNRDGVILHTSTGAIIRAGCAIIAAGGGAIRPKRPPLDGIEELEGNDVFYAIHKAEQFKKRKVVIAGGGDSAIDWALLLADIADHVYIVHRRDKFRAMDASLAKLRAIANVTNARVQIITPYQLSSLSVANSRLTGVEIVDLDGNSRMLDADALIPCFGLENDLGPIENWGLELDDGKIIVAASSLETNKERIYAIGDTASYPGKLKLILTGFAEAALACHHARQQMYPNQVWHFEYSTTKGLPRMEETENL
ncbi:MAG: NAD(P)/FAD-dependent oxidoreductase [Proteobacteria bacterium]|nr:NAD(P)/FAD-dependent oxidoreductase [Pseudomonadota bacterium]